MSYLASFQLNFPISKIGIIIGLPRMLRWNELMSRMKSKPQRTISHVVHRSIMSSAIHSTFLWPPVLPLTRFHWLPVPTPLRYVPFSCLAAVRLASKLVISCLMPAASFSLLSLTLLFLIHQLPEALLGNLMTSFPFFWLLFKERGALNPWHPRLPFYASIMFFWAYHKQGTSGYHVLLPRYPFA